MENPQLSKRANNRRNQAGVLRCDRGVKGHKDAGEIHRQRRGRNEKQHGEDEKVNVDRMKVSKLVQDKLEEYINYRKRQERFDPGGVYRTTPRMYAYDITYKVLDHLDVGERNRTLGGRHQPSGAARYTCLAPKYYTYSRQVTPKKEATRLTKYAEQLLEKFPIEKLNVIHRYRPNCPNVQRSVNNGDISNYSCHLGAALNTYSYIQYYIKQGLDNGNPKHCSRLKKLQKTKFENKEKTKDRDFQSGLDELENIDTAMGRMTRDDQQKPSEVIVFTDAAVQTDKDRERNGASDEPEVSSSDVTNTTTPVDSQAQETQTDA